MPNLILNLARAVLLCLQAALRRRRHHSTRSVSYCTGLSLRQPPSGAPQNVTWESEITYTRASRLPPTRRHLTRQNTARGGSSRHRRASTGAREESYCTGRWPPPNPGRLCLPATTSQPPPAPPGRGPCCLPARPSRQLRQGPKPRWRKAYRKAARGRALSAPVKTSVRLHSQSDKLVCRVHRVSSQNRPAGRLAPSEDHHTAVEGRTSGILFRSGDDTRFASSCNHPTPGSNSKAEGRVSASLLDHVAGAQGCSREDGERAVQMTTSKHTMRT
jgi:hypothetical protein